MYLNEIHEEIKLTIFQLFLYIWNILFHALPLNAIDTWLSDFNWPLSCRCVYSWQLQANRFDKASRKISSRTTSTRWRKVERTNQFFNEKHSTLEEKRSNSWSEKKKNIFSKSISASVLFCFTEKKTSLISRSILKHKLLEIVLKNKKDISISRLKEHLSSNNNRKRFFAIFQM